MLHFYQPSQFPMFGDYDPFASLVKLLQDVSKIIQFREQSMMGRALALGIIFALLQGCATNRVSITDEQKAKITELEAEVIVNQDEIIAEVTAANGAVGGVIGVMVSNSITNSRVQDAQQIMGPFYASIG